MRTRLQVAWTPGAPTPVDEDLDDRVSAAHTLLTGRSTVVLTGAGISTDSGIPDYRSPDAAPRTPMTIDAFLASAEFRRHYWARNHLGWRHLDAATPNAGHRAVAALQRLGTVRGVITQNIDMLHTKAGSRPVLELHGCYGRVCCLDCGWQISRHRLATVLDPLNVEFTARVRSRGALDVAPDADVAVDDTRDFTMIDCPACGGPLKPAIVYFGESVPRPVVDEAYAMIDAADALMVLGSSLTVMSGLRFVRRARKRGIPVIIVNRGATRGDDCATLKIDHRCADVLDGLVSRMQDAASARSHITAPTASARGHITAPTPSARGDQIVGVHHRAS